jgi:endonuclease-3
VIFDLLRREFPQPERMKRKSEPLDVLIATMLSQNTTDKTSYRAFQNLKERFGDWEGVMKAPISKVKSAIKVCGLANQKAKRIRSLLRSIKRRHGMLSLRSLFKKSNEEVYKELVRYDGIGIKTASCVLAFSLGRNVFPVDTHIHRVSNRLGLVHTKSPEKTHEIMEKTVPDEMKFPFHKMLIKFGRKICRANNPLCGQCILYDLCEFKDKEEYCERKIPEVRENNFIILEHV